MMSCGMQSNGLSSAGTDFSNINSDESSAATFASNEGDDSFSDFSAPTYTQKAPMGGSSLAPTSITDAEPVSIPVTVAKLEMPDVSKIKVGVGDMRMAFMGEEGAVLNASDNLYLTVKPESAPQRMLVKINKDGSFPAFLLPMTSMDDRLEFTITNFRASSEVFYLERDIDGIYQWLIPNLDFADGFESIVVEPIYMKNYYKQY